MKVLIVILLVIVLLVLLSPYLLRWGMKLLARRLSKMMEEPGERPAASDASDPKQRERHEKTVREVNKIFDDDEGSYVDFKEEKRP